MDSLDTHREPCVIRRPTYSPSHDSRPSAVHTGNRPPLCVHHSTHAPYLRQRLAASCLVAPVRLPVSARAVFHCRMARPTRPQCPAPLPFSDGTKPSCALNRASSLRYSASAFSSNSYAKCSSQQYKVNKTFASRAGWRGEESRPFVRDAADVQPGGKKGVATLQRSRCRTRASNVDEDRQRLQSTSSNQYLLTVCCKA